MSNESNSKSLIKNRIKEIKNNFKPFLKIILKNEIVELIPVDGSDESIRLMTKWRKENMGFFYTKFQSTEERTRKWFNDIYLPDNTRVLFFIMYKNEKIGHAGIFNYNEEENSVTLDNFVREPTKGERGLMDLVELSIMKFSFVKLEVQKILVDLFGDNIQANLLHKRCGFKIVKKIPLKKINVNNDISWIKDETLSSTNKYANILEIQKNEFLEKNQELSKILFL